MTRLDQLQAVIDDPDGILSDAQIGEYVALCAAKAADANAAEQQRQAEAAAEEKRVAGLRGVARIKHVLKARQA